MSDQDHLTRREVLERGLWAGGGYIVAQDVGVNVFRPTCVPLKLEFNVQASFPTEQAVAQTSSVLPTCRVVSDLDADS